MQLSAALEFAMEAPQLVVYHHNLWCYAAGVHLQHIVVHHLFHRWCTTCGLFLLMHHNEVVVHKLQVYHLQIVVHQVYHLMHHLLCSAGRRPANENEVIVVSCGGPQLLVYHQKCSRWQVAAGGILFVLQHHKCCISQVYHLLHIVVHQVYHLMPPLVSQQVYHLL